LQGLDVIDAHGHTPPHTRGWVIRRQDYAGATAELVGLMDRLGVGRLIVSPEAALFGPCLEGNREAEAFLAPRGGRFSGYLVFNPRYADDLVPQLDAFFGRGFFVGFKLLPGYWNIPVTDPSYRPVWDYADRHRLPILLHTWDDPYDSPAMLSEIAPRYPQAVFLLGHSGGGTRGRFEAEALARANKNVYLEFCGSFTTPRPFETSMEIVGKDRIVFGSDAAAHDMAWELGRYLSLPLPDDDLILGLGATLRGLLEAGKRTANGHE
ncbi:MAG: amidohydrolase family protein, partial [Lentisphaerae bacterium]|nr:amidohydrolase family protein [Lentisphaerota bacterium]